MIASIRQSTGGYGPAIRVIAIVMVCALVLPILARYRPKPKQVPVPSEPGLRRVA
jgi:hypothetical protein